jgi:hypothetical protein
MERSTPQTWLGSRVSRVGVGEALAERKTVASKAAMERVLAKENILIV